MSEVKRYYAEIAEENDYGGFVLASDFDRITAERDAVLEDLRLVKQLQKTTDAIVMMVEGQRDHWIEKCHALQQCLTAADERADQAATIIRKWKEIFGESMARRSELYVVTDAFLSALKPAEGGGDEPFCTICCGKKTVRMPAAKFVRDCPRCCHEEG